MSKKSSNFAARNNKHDMMTKRNHISLIIVLLCAMAQGVWAEGTPVMRFVPVAGTETEVPLNTLRKVVFTPDSVVLIAAADGTATPMHKYDYRAIVFDESSSTGVEEEVRTKNLELRAEKFIRDGQFYIRRDGQVYDIMGRKR